MLAPIQQTIREFIQEATATCQKPDIHAFRRAILPDIEAITTRADLLAKLIAAFPKLGAEIKDALSGLTGAAGGGRIEINFSGPVSVRSEADIDAIGRQLVTLIRGGCHHNEKHV